MDTITELPRFALAKIQPPRPRAGQVERPALEAALGRALRDCRLVLLLAPAGYGKTVALTRQLGRLPRDWALAWVSADGEDQLQRFLACLTAALEPHDLPWRVAPEALATLALGERGLRGAAGEIVNALAGAACPRGLIMIDDAHRLGDPRVFELLQLVLDRLPDSWGLVIASRVEPPLALARLRVSGELAEFRREEMRFAESEVAALLASIGGEVSAATVQALVARTDGWAAGLRLSVAAQGREPSAPHGGGRGSAQRHLFDFLASEVLDDMPDELRDFLLRCSVLPEMTAARCAHVSGQAQAARLLDEVERRGLFVSLLEADELTLRLHDLFRDFLQDRLQRDHAHELPALLRRAADHEPDLARAVGTLARAAAWDEAARRLARDGPELLTRGGGAGLVQMLALFPASEFERRPDLCWLSGLATFPRFDFDALVSTMQRAAEGYARDGREDEAALASAYACIGLQSTARLDQSASSLAALLQQPLRPATRALVYFGQAWAAYAGARAEDVAPNIRGMLDALEQVDEVQSWDGCFFQSLFVGLPGMAPLHARFVQGALDRLGDVPTQLRAATFHLRAWLALASGRLGEAAQQLAQADDDCRWLGHPRRLMTDNRIAHMLIDALHGRGDAALAAGQAAEDDFEQGSLSNRLAHRADLLFIQCRARWVLGDAAGVRHIDATLARIANAHEWRIAPLYRQCTRAMVAMLDERWDDALAALAPLAQDIDRSGFFPAAQARWMQADVLWRLGRGDAAGQVLRPWFAQARRTGEIGAAWLAGPAVLDRLADAGAALGLPVDDTALLRQLLAQLTAVREDPACRASPAQRSVPPAWPLPAMTTPSSAPRPDAGPWGLTEREREVLARLAAGDSNKLIARAFDLSPHTVKRHVANILGKLGADTRGQAAARWREIGG